MSLGTNVVGTALIATALLVSSALAGKPTDQQPNERTVFVTGSLIPQRIKLKAVGTTTVSPVRIIDRREIDATGRRTAAGILIADPSGRVVGH
jgi:outer membrane cobalamin receptor